MEGVYKTEHVETWDILEKLKALEEHTGEHYYIVFFGDGSGHIVSETKDQEYLTLFVNKVSFDNIQQAREIIYKLRFKQ